MINWLKRFFRDRKLKKQIRYLEIKEEDFKRFQQEDRPRKKHDLYAELLETDFTEGTIIDYNDLTLEERGRSTIGNTVVQRNGTLEINTLLGKRYHISKVRNIIKHEGAFHVDMDYPQRDYILAPANIEVPKQNKKSLKQ